MGKSYRHNAEKSEKSFKNGKNDFLRRDMERREKALVRSLETMKTIRKGFTLFELIFVMFALSIIGGIGYVLIHFISKFW